MIPTQFILTLHDRNGEQLSIGDIVAVSDGMHFRFYAEVAYLPECGSLSPFHNFSFLSFEKVDAVPEGAIRADEPRYGVWYMPEQGKEDTTGKQFSDYLADWRQCEHLLRRKCYRIHLDSLTDQSAA